MNNKLRTFTVTSFNRLNLSTLATLSVMAFSLSGAALATRYLTGGTIGATGITVIAGDVGYRVSETVRS